MVETCKEHFSTQKNNIHCKYIKSLYSHNNVFIYTSRKWVDKTFVSTISPIKIYPGARNKTMVFPFKGPILVLVPMKKTLHAPRCCHKKRFSRTEQ